ncbi:hypothetical protein RIR_jg35658.t1 [Rhizophagus irregularis DAOM 181602=DAOM 197198]|nr:hypothetical protein RIR_jg35658.t1 [Rhizophagus irregularis DAOM 181602=DAOM 197198]
MIKHTFIDVNLQRFIISEPPKHSSMRDKPLEYLKITSALLPPSQPPPDECLPMLYLSNKKFAVTKCQLCLISFFHIKAGPSHTSNQNKSI